MSELLDRMLLDVSQPLAELDKLEARLDKILRAREAPLKLPTLPAEPTRHAPAKSRPDRRAEEAQLDRLSNRLKVVQQELKRLGDEATPAQLEQLERRLARLTTQAELLAPGMDQGSRAAVKLGNVMNGLIGTSTDVQAALGRVGGQGLPGVTTVDQQIKSLSKSVGTVSNLWRTQILTDEQAGQSALQLRDKLLKLAASEDASADAVLKAAQAAAQAQRTLDQSRGDQTKGGFAYNASIGILDALSRAGGPLGAAAFGLGTMVNTGLLGGLLAGKPKVGKGAQDIGDEVIGAFKTKLEIRSPSRVTTRFGLNVAEGLAVGMKSGMAQVAKSGFDLGAAAQGGVKSGLGTGPAAPNTAKLGQTLGGASGALGKVGADAGNGAAQLGKFALNAEQVAFVAGAATTALLALAAGMAQVVQSGAALDEQLVNIKALTQPTAQELEQLKEAALNLGTDLGVGPTEAAKAILELNKAGLTAADAVGGGLAGALNLAGAAGIEAGRGANLAVAAMTAFGLQAKDLPKIADVFANFANKTVLSAEDLSQFFASLGPVAKDAGLSIEQVAGYAASLAQGGFKEMSDAGTSFKTFLGSLQSPSDTAKAALKDLKVSFYDAAGATRPLGDVLEEVRSKLADLTDQERNGKITDIFGSDAGRAARVFFGTTNAAIEANIKAMGLQGEAARVARERMGSLVGQGKALKAEWEKFTATIGLMLVPALTSVVKVSRLVVEGGNAVLNGFKQIGNYAPQLATLLAGIGLAYIYVRQEAIKTAAINAWAGLPAVWGAVRVGVLAAATAIKTTYIPAIIAAAKSTAAFLVANPWLLVIAGVTAAGIAIQTHFQQINNTYEQMDQANQDSFNATMARVQALREAGGELNNTKAKYLLALEQLKSAEEGQVTGVNALGERQVKTDPKEIERARARVKELGDEIVRLNTEQGRRGTLPKVKVVDPDDLKKQQEALKDLREELSKRALNIRLQGMTEVQSQLIQLGSDFDALRVKVKSAFGWDMDSPELQKALKEIDTARSAETTSILRQGLEDQKKVRLDHEKDVRAAEAALSRDALVQRRAEAEAQIRELKATYDKEVTDALTNAKAAGPGAQRSEYYAEAARLQGLQAREVAAAEQQLDQDLQKIEQDRLDRVRSAQREVLDLQAKTTEATLRQLEGQRDRELALAGDVPAARLAVEQRYAPQFEKLRREQAEISGQAERAALYATYQQQLRDAEDAGAQRGALEQAARKAYLEGLRELELRSQADLQADLLAQEERVQKERLAVYKEALDQRLSRLKDATGQEIAALEAVLRAERARAVAAGDGGRVGAIDDGLKKVNDVKLDNLRDFRDTLTESSEKAGELRTQLRDIAQTPLEAAVKSAVSPFDGILKGAEKEMEALRKAYNKIATPTAAQTDAFRRREQQLTGIITTATAQRTQAQAGAEAKYWQAREDKAEETHLKLSKRELDLGRLTMDGYAQVLDADRAYWETRLTHAVKGSEDEQAAQDKLRENEDERLRLQGERRAYAKDSAAFSREELQTALELATNEKDRSAALERLNAADQRRLGDLDREIASLTQQGGHEKDILALKRERAGVQKDLVTRQREELDHARALTDAILARVDAENKLAQRRARTDAGVLAAQLGSLANLQNQLSALDTNIGNARSDEERNRLLAERSNLLGQIEDQEMAIAQLPLDIERQKAEVLKSQTQLRLQQLGLQDDELSVAQAAVAEAESTLTLARQQLDLMREKGTPEQQRVAELAYNQAQVGLLTAQNALQDAPIKAQERRLGLYRQLAQAQLTLNGLQDDEVMSADLALELAQRDLQLAQDKVAAAKTGAEQEAAAAGLRVAQAAVRTAQQQVNDAPVKAEERRLGLIRQVAQARLVLSGLDDNEVESARAALSAAEGQLALAQHRVDVAGTAVEKEKAAADLVTAQADAEKARAAVRQAGVTQLERQLGVVKQLAQAQLILRGLNDDELAQARQAVSFAEQDLALAQQRLAVARTPVEREKAGADVTGAQAALLQAQQQQRLAPIAQQERLLGLFRQQADERRVVAGLDEDAVATGQQALLIAQEETRLAQARVDAGGTLVQVEQAQGELAAKRTAELQAQRSLIRAQLADLDASRDRMRSQVQAQAELSGLTRDGVVARALDLELTRLDRQETERRLSQARELMLTETEVADLQVKRTQQLAQEAKARQEVNKAALEQQRLQLDLAEATARSQLARSRFFDDAVAQGRIGLAVTRQQLRLLNEELAQADELGLSVAEQLGLQKERQGLLAQEAEGVRQLAQAERDRLVFVRSLRDALDGLRGAAQDQSEATAILRASDAAALALNRLRETQADAAEFLSRGDGPFAYHEAAQGKERVEALTSAIGDYRSKLAAVADAQEQRITSMEGMIDAVRRLNDLSNSPAASAFTVEVVERQRQQALAETSRVLNDQRATYGQIASAVGRLAQAEGDRISAQQKQLAGLADRVKGGDKDALSDLRQQLSDLGLSWREVNATIGKVQKEGSSALGSVTARLSQEAEARLDELRGRALDALNDIGQLRAEAFKNRLETAKAFEEYARLSSAVKLADAGFSELEADQLATINRQEQLKNLIAQTSALDPGFISRKDARAAVEAENRALVEQVRLRKNLTDVRQVTRADLEQQRAISAQWVQQSALQRSAAEAALVPYSQRVKLGKQTAEALKEEEAQLARMVAKREGGDPAQVSRAKIEQQRRLLEQEIIVQERTRRILGKNDKQAYDPSSPEVKAALALDLAIEDARYSDKRMKRALNFEKEKARQVAEIYAAAIAAAIQKALESTRVGGAARNLGETAGTALQQEMASVVRPNARPATMPLSSAEQNRALAAALRVTVEAPRPPVMAAAPQINNNQKTVTVIYNVGGISVPVHTVEKVDSGKVAYEVLDHIQRLNDLTGIVRCD